MKKKQNIRLKQQSAQNEKNCWGRLALARAIHPQTVVIDATSEEGGEIKYSVYTCEGETLLQQRALIFIGLPNIYDLVVIRGKGSLITVLADEDDVPEWMKEHGECVPVAS